MFASCYANGFPYSALFLSCYTTRCLKQEITINSNSESHKVPAPRGISWALLQIQYKECLSSAINEKKKKVLQFKTSFSASSRNNLFKNIRKKSIKIGNDPFNVKKYLC